MPSIVLRFADYDQDTIDRHRDILRTESSVCWGWWKKAHEPWPADAIAGLAAGVPSTVWLLNRLSDDGDAKCYVATIGAVYSDDGRRLGSPAPRRTPAYYRDSRHPLWFEFTAIADASIEDFVREFGRVPVGDRTFFVEPQPSPEEVASGYRRVDGEAILHLSDLHFGADHDFPLRDADAPFGVRSLQSIITNAIAGVPVGVVVVSGDLITRGDSNNIPAAVDFLNDLTATLHLDREQVVIVPGNHDIWIEDFDQATRDFSHENPYRMLLRTFYAAEVEIEALRTYVTPAGWSLSFACLNSNRPRSHATKEYGFVGQDRYQPLFDGIKSGNEGLTASELVHQKRLNFAVLHHHLLPSALVCLPEEERPVSLTLDAGQLVADMQSVGVHVALHGHQHVPFVGSTGRARRDGDRWVGHDERLYVVGAGSAGVNASRLYNEMRQNSFGLYLPTAAGLAVQMFEFNRSQVPREYLAVELTF